MKEKVKNSFLVVGLERDYGIGSAGPRSRGRGEIKAFLVPSPFTQNAELVWFMPHMHLRGKDMT
jgi:hypothetical protein